MLPTDSGLESQSETGLMRHQTTIQAGCWKEEAWCWADTPVSTACCPLKSGNYWLNICSQNAVRYFVRGHWQNLARFEEPAEYG